MSKERTVSSDLELADELLLGIEHAIYFIRKAISNKNFRSGQKDVHLIVELAERLHKQLGIIPLRTSQRRAIKDATENERTDLKKIDKKLDETNDELCKISDAIDNAIGVILNDYSGLEQYATSYRMISDLELTDPAKPMAIKNSIQNEEIDPFFNRKLKQGLVKKIVKITAAPENKNYSPLFRNLSDDSFPEIYLDDILQIKEFQIEISFNVVKKIKAPF
ncbi:hypothetical protein [Desulfogranum marinum]|uniref:hypothetical protein n=1 Tax=Desulfogranum marinum TaxID=453220 RepID=UPI001964C34F|nr:hypothetical protein [Desulfogranum marinum]MBM9515190.1 hypothetical protein [Desulfogranum marinum]